MTGNIPRNEYPRPQFVRGSWMNLNGEWDFSFDEPVFDQKIIVPYAYQSKLSGIHRTERHDVVWYRRSFDIPASMAGKRILLHFGAVDYACEAWVNDKSVALHEGGHTGFFADITFALREKGNELRVRVEDVATDLEMPRGKQFWEDRSRGIFYTRTTGIYQTVWLEPLNDSFLSEVFITPDLDARAVEIEYALGGEPAESLEVAVSFDNKAVAIQAVRNPASRGKCRLYLDKPSSGIWNFPEELSWSPENPRLFDISFRLKAGTDVVDTVNSYFGMRKVSVENGRFMLNNRPYYQKLLLDQGYWRESLLTAPDDEAFVRDISIAKQMGFNGVRKHQKIEDPRFLYHADRMGLLVWGEFPAAYVYSRRYVQRMTREWVEAVLRDYNHPCIVAWTPLNESWGVPGILRDSAQQSHSASLVHLTKSLDGSRPVISNDGWEHTCTDLLTIHDYASDKAVLKARYGNLESILSGLHAGRRMFAEGWAYEGQPILLTEVGGISFRKDAQEGWGYSHAVSEADFALRYYQVISAMLESPPVQGFCYTQLTDVEQEINGLLTYDRAPKINPETLRAINEGKWRPGDPV